MNAELFAVGEYAPHLATNLEHEPRRYADVAPGTRVLSCLARAPGSTASRDLARALRIDPWRFEQHDIEGSAVDVAELRTWGVTMGRPTLGEDFIQLRDAGFRFFFLPNG